MEYPIAEFRKSEFVISTDKSRLDVQAIHFFLANKTHWGRDIPLTTVQRSIEHSLCFGLYHDDRLIGFARVITDFAIFANLQDVFIIEEYRGKGLAKWLLESIVNLPELQGMRRWTLATRDAHGLYAKFGFKPLNKPETFMEIYTPDVFSRAHDNR